MAKSNNITLAPALDKIIRCAMTDGEYHEVLYELGTIEGVLELVRPRADDCDAGMIVGLRVVAEKIKHAQNLMEAAWHKTRASE